MISDAPRPESTPAPRIVAAGVDSLWLTYGLVPRRALLQELEEAKAAAARSKKVGAHPLTGEPLLPDPHPVTFGGVPWRIRAYGSAEGSILGEHPDFGSFALAPEAPADKPVWKLRVSAKALWADGIQDCIARADWCAGDLARPGEDFGRRYVPEIHIAADVQGWCPSREDVKHFSNRGSPTLMVHDADERLAWPEDQAMTFAPKHVRAALSDRERASLEEYRKATRFDTSREFYRFGDVGFVFGKGAWQVAGYNKSREIGVHSKEWFRQVWAKSPEYDPAKPVYRVEARCGREALKELRDEGSVPLETVEDVTRNVSSIWRTSLDGKIRLTTNDATRKSRSSTHWAWAALRDTVEFDGTSSGFVTRHEQDTISAEALIPYLRGYIGKYGGLRGHTTLKATLTDLEAGVAKESEERGEPFDKLLVTKREERAGFDVKREILNAIATKTRRARGVACEWRSTVRRARRWASQLELQFPWKRRAQQLAFAWKAAAA